MEGIDVQQIVRQAIEEYVSRDKTSPAQPSFEEELREERKHREALERKLNALVEENERNRRLAAEAERRAAIRAELQRLGVAKIDLAYKAVEEHIALDESGKFIARTDAGDISLRTYLQEFVHENPELLDRPRLLAVVDLSRIRPGMLPEEQQRVREEIVRVASQGFRGL